MTHQTAVLEPVPPHASFVSLDLRGGCTPADALGQVAALYPLEWLLVGIGPALLAAVGCSIEGLRPMPSLSGEGPTIPSTPTDLILRVDGADPGEALHAERLILSRLPAFQVVDRVAGFVYGESRDLSGYVDGTENPTGDAALETALMSGRGPGLDGSSVLAVQRWVHDFSVFEAMSRADQDAMIGRDRETNEELEDAPASAHVKRTAQEDFQPEAFLVRRSMPWRDHRGAGLIFVSFSASIEPFEAQLLRMLGLEDGVTDALFQFTKAVTGATYWCPPVHEGRLDLRACRSGA